MGLILCAQIICFIVFKDLNTILLTQYKIFNVNFLAGIRLISVGFTIVLFFIFVLLYKPKTLKRFILTAQIILSLGLTGLSIIFVPDIIQQSLQKPFANSFADLSSFFTVSIWKQYWSVILFFYLTYIWSPFFIVLLFWTLANQTFNYQSARYIYPIYMLLAFITIFVFDKIKGVFYQSIQIIQLMSTLVPATLLFSTIMVSLYVFCTRKETCSNSWISSLRVLQNNKSDIKSKYSYLFWLMVLALVYGMCAALQEFLWKDLIANSINDQAQYQNFLVNFISEKMKWGIVITFATFWIIWAFNWSRTAFIAPFIFLLSTITFYSSILYPEQFASIIGLVDKPSNLVPIYLGNLHSIIFSSLFITIIRPTKELAYIPLLPYTRARAKATIDFLLPALGLLFSFAIGAFISKFIPQAQQAIPIFFVIKLFLISLWMLSIIKLEKRIKHFE